MKSKYDNQTQEPSIPLPLSELIPKAHPVRVINRIINEIDIGEIEEEYTCDGVTSYSSRMLIKLLIYSYMNNVYSGRRIEELTQEYIHYLWLSEMQRPDHNTINRFRYKYAAGNFKMVFSRIVLFFNKSGVLTITETHTDNTKIRANTNKYSFVWGKGVQTDKKVILSQVNELWNYARKICKKELKDTRPNTSSEISHEVLQEVIEEINQTRENKDI